MASKVELDALVSCLLQQGIGNYNAAIVRDKLADATPKSSDDVRAILAGSLESPTIEKVCKLIEDGIPVDKSDAKTAKASELKSLRKTVAEQGERIDAQDESIRALDSILADQSSAIEKLNTPLPLPDGE